MIGEPAAQAGEWPAAAAELEATHPATADEAPDGRDGAAAVPDGTSGDGAPGGDGGDGGEVSTRDRILAAAMDLFTERGYDRTTMRAVASEAGLSVGNAYYYFASKEHLIQGFYDLIMAEHRERALPAIAAGSSFTDRLTAVLLAWVDTVEPHHAFASQFFRHAADPRSPMNPFSEESRIPREVAVDTMAQVVAGSDVRADAEVVGRLPQLLWLYQMGVVLFWVYDSSEGSRRTRVLVERSVPLVDRLLRLSRNPLLQPVTRQSMRLLDDLGWRQL